MSSVPASPNKRLKTQIEDDSNHRLDLRPSSDENQPDDSCGICFADLGASIRGEIDCCNHSFCFVCIMEWSKHESRCPLCRQRFSAVRRPPKPGVFPSSRLVKVPLRDQVYHVHGNMTTGPVDPYAETQCSVCNGRDDESFLLLCDLCDTASHTYCVGLGYTVPEDDWFCHDCTLSRATSDNNDIDHPCDRPTVEPSVTIHDIVRKPNSQVVRRPIPSPFVMPLPDRVNRDEDRNPDSGARTLRRCRNVQRSIQAFRKNWNALRSGSVRFYSNSSESGVWHSKKQKSDSSAHGKSGQPHYLAYTSLQQSTIQGSSSSTTSHDRDSKDVDKAWKMLERAKMIRKSNHRIGILPLGMDHPSRGAGPRKASNIHCNNQELKIQQSRRSTGKFSSFYKDMDNHWPPELGEHKHRRVSHSETVQHTGDQASHLEESCEPSLPRREHSSIQGAPCHENRGRNFATGQSRSSCLVTTVGSSPSDGKFGRVSSSREVDKKSFGNVKTRESEDAKNEIKSIVKLNLKVLSKDKRLGVDAFKEIARQSTRTILAACRLEHQKRDTSSSSSMCSHSVDVQHLHKSTLMPNCCRQCFYKFVNDVVHSTMTETVGCDGSSRTILSYYKA